MLISESIGKSNKSKMLLTKFDDECKDFRNNKLIEFEMPNMLEQLTISEDDELYTIYESNSDKYSTGIRHSSDILIEDINVKIKEYFKKL